MAIAAGWKRPFEDPVPISRGRELVTLEEANHYIQRLRKAERDLEVWQTAGTILIGAAEGREPLLHARIAMLRAIRRGRPAEAPAPRRKAAKAYRIVR